MEGGDILDPLDYLGVRYHYNGHFVQIDGIIDYNGELEAEIPIERDQLSYQYILEVAKDLYDVEEEYVIKNRLMKLYWLLPGKSFADGLCFLYDDESVQKMDSFVADGGHADIYVDQVEANRNSDASHKGSEKQPAGDGMFDIAVSERYTAYKGAKMPLVNVEVVDTRYVEALLKCDVAFPQVREEAPVVVDMKGKGPAVAQKKEAVRVALGGLKINDNVPRASSHAMYQPSHCVFNLAAFKAAKK